MKLIKDSYFRNILLIALLIRFLIMPFYFHPDIKTYNFQASFLRNGVLDIYSYLSDHKQSLTLKEDFVYFPLTYYFLGGYQILVSPLLGNGFYDWLADASASAPERVGVARYLFLLKIPYLMLDIFMAFLLMRFFDDTRDKKKAFALWLLNPFSIILIYVFSNVDIIPVVFTLISILLASKGKIAYSGLLLGIGAGFKAYPLLFLPLLLLFSKSIKQKVLATILCLGSVGLVIAPFLKSQAFREATLVSGLTTRIVFPNIDIGFNEALMLSIVTISALLFFSILNKGSERKDIWKYYLTLLLFVFSFIHFHIQWLLWVAPFLIILVVSSSKFNLAAILLALFAFSIPILYNDKSMNVALFQVFSPLFNLVPTPFAIMQRLYDPYMVQGVLHSALAGGSLVVTWKMFAEKT